MVEGRNNIHVQMMRARNSRIEGGTPLFTGFLSGCDFLFYVYRIFSGTGPRIVRKVFFYGDCPHQSHRSFLNSPKLMNDDDENENDDDTTRNDD